MFLVQKTKSEATHPLSLGAKYKKIRYSFVMATKIAGKDIDKSLDSKVKGVKRAKFSVPSRNPNGNRPKNGISKEAKAELRKYPANTTNPDAPLNDQMIKFVQCIAHYGMAPSQAAAQAGYSSALKMGSNLMRRPNIQKAIQIERQKYEEASQMTRKKVIDGFLEAIEIGKMKADGLVMVAGWREIAKMCGYFAPVQHKIDISIGGSVTMQKLQGLSDHELLQLAESAKDPIEGEFSVVNR